MFSEVKKQKTINEVLARAFFCESAGRPGYWTCKCGTTRKRQGSGGWSNLAEHIRSNHRLDAESFMKELDSYPEASKVLLPPTDNSTLDDHFGSVGEFSNTVYKWLDWVISDDLPFNFVEKGRTKLYSNIKSISSKTFKKYLFKLTDAVKEKIKQDLPKTFGLMFDGWTVGTEHYLGLFAVYMSDGRLKKVLLACRVQDDVTDETEFTAEVRNDEKYFGLSAEDLYDEIYATLLDYGFSEEQLANMEDIVEFFTADNCSTNRSMCKKAGIPFIGCKSHLLNLAIKIYCGELDYTDPDENDDTKASARRRCDLINKIDYLMGKLFTIKNSAVLRSADITTLPRRKNKTRWNSIYKMLDAALKMYAVKNLDTLPFPSGDVFLYFLSEEELDDLAELFEIFGKLESISVELQESGLSLLVAQALLEGVSDIPGFENISHLKAEYMKSKHNGVDYSLDYHFLNGNKL